jgi:nitrate/nitrite transport system substrate-binding protein
MEQTGNDEATAPMRSFPRLPDMTNDIDRRSVLKLFGAAAGATVTGGLLASCSDSSSSSSPATSKSKGPLRKVKLGFIALTDCAPLVMAKELGYFAERGLDVELVKQANWPGTRDNLLTGQIDAAHCLFSMPFSVASGVSGTGTALKIAMVLNNNGQAITLNKDLKAAGYADLAAAKGVLESKAPTLAMTYKGGTHDTWLRYWLKATKADLAKVKIIPVPPPQMVANMTVGNMSGYCVGEPWNAVAVKKGIGFTHLATQDLWQHHPEKALVVNEKFATVQQDVLEDVMAAVLKACKWLDDLDNRSKAADTIGAANYVNAPAAEIRGRLTGVYDLGAGLGTKTFGADKMNFFRDGLVNMPRTSHAIWFLTQYQRFGLLKTAPDYKALADSVILSDLYAKVAKKEGISLPDDDMKPFDIKLDGVTFDPAKPALEAGRP